METEYIFGSPLLGAMMPQFYFITQDQNKLHSVDVMVKYQRKLYKDLKYFNIKDISKYRPTKQEICKLKNKHDINSSECEICKLEKNINSEAIFISPSLIPNIEHLLGWKNYKPSPISFDFSKYKNINFTFNVHSIMDCLCNILREERWYKIVYINDKVDHIELVF